MIPSTKTWSIVLAAGEGSRLRELTGIAGTAIPKQFCSLRGGRSLLQQTLARAHRLTPRKRTLVVVAEEHRHLWSLQLAGFPPENVVVQPANRGTAAGLLLPLLTVLERDPGARVVFLPSDHHVNREDLLERSLRLALDAQDEPDAGVTLVGIRPDAAEEGYGWIVPAGGPEVLRRVARFVEKPDGHLARHLYVSGAVWNSFLMVGCGTAFLDLYRQRRPELLEAMQAAQVLPDDLARAEAFRSVYRTLESLDFSRELLQGNEARLRLAVAPACGWTDLGTRERVEACLADLVTPALSRRRVSARYAAFDLSQALERLRELTGPRTPVAV